MHRTAGFKGSAVHVTYEKEDRVLILAFKVRKYTQYALRLLHLDSVLSHDAQKTHCRVAWPRCVMAAVRSEEAMRPC